MPTTFFFNLPLLHVIVLFGFGLAVTTGFTSALGVGVGDATGVGVAIGVGVGEATGVGVGVGATLFTGE